jgi:recombination DNA repair RAD52 pathway protein
MKNLLLFLLLIPNFIFGQYVTIPTHYDSEHTAQHIMKGHVKMFLKDTTVWTVEKKNERYVTSWYGPDVIKIKLNKVFEKGKLEYISRRNGGYIFTIAVVDQIDNTKVINYCTFHVDGWTQKIEEIEILLGE